MLIIVIITGYRLLFCAISLIFTSLKTNNNRRFNGAAAGVLRAGRLYMYSVRLSIDDSLFV